MHVFICLIFILFFGDKMAKAFKNEDKVLINEIPKKWYNILVDLPKPLPPPLHPGTKEPIKPSDMEPLFPKELIRQEMLDKRYLEIPEELKETYYRLGRPTPLYRARRLEQKLKTPAKIYFKREDVSFAGSHKTNTSIAQAYFNMKEGVEKLSTETGAGQWGSALALACSMFDLKCEVFMVRVSYEQKPYRKYIMKLYGAEVHPSPSNVTEFGKKMLAKDPDNPGSLGIAISEAIEIAVKDGKTKYSLGSVLNHVLLHQSVIGQELMVQLDAIDVEPDVMIGCVGGGSNFGGFANPMIGEKLKGKKYANTQFIAVEPTSCPSLTGSCDGKSKYEYDFGDTAGMTPLLMMYTLGHDFIPPPIHAGGLRYHGMSPIVSLLYKEKVIGAEAYEQEKVFEAASLFANTEGIIPAPETAHAIASAIEQAKKCKETNEAKTIVFNLSGHGLLDLQGYANILKM